MNQELIERLKEVMAHFELSSNAFAKKINVDPSNWKKMLDGVQPITKKTIEKIEVAIPALNYYWLKTGEGSMLDDEVEVYNKVYEEEDEEDDDMVPLLPVSAMAGSLMGFSDSIRRGDCQKIKSNVPGAEWAIQISGDSMEPKYHNGSYIYIRKMSGSFIPWGQVMVIDTCDGVVLKEIYPSDDDNYIEAHSTNPKYPPFKIEKSIILGIYRVLGGGFINSTM